MTGSSGRYLLYEHPRPFLGGGLKHWSLNLLWLLLEAYASDRLAVLPPLLMTPKHNFGIAHAWRWDTYFDLDASRVVDLRTGHRRPLPLCREFAPAGLARTDIPYRQPLPRRSEAALAVRQVANSYRKFLPNRFVGRGRVARLLRMSTAGGICFAFAAPVREMARKVVHALGGPGGFVAVHVRRGDRLSPRRERLTSPAGIHLRLRRLGVPEGATVFFLSDERDPAYWTLLYRHYAVVRYLDFAELRALVSATAPPDNYLLFAVEREIMRHARLQVETLSRSSVPIVRKHSNWYSKRCEMLF